MSEVEFLGPFVGVQYYQLICKGVAIPHVKGRDSGDGTFDLVSGSVAFGGFTREEVEHLIPVLARVSARSAGYTCHGPDSEPRNRHKRPLIRSLGYVVGGDDPDPPRPSLRAVTADESVDPPRGGGR